MSDPEGLHDLNVPSRSDMRWADMAAELEFTQLDSVRATASKWRDVLVSLVALISTAIAIGGPRSAQGLAACDRIIVGLLLGVSLATLLAAVVVSASASFGIPTKIALTGEALRSWSSDTTTCAVRSIKISLVLFVVGISGVAISGLIGFIAS